MLPLLPKTTTLRIYDSGNESPASFLATLPHNSRGNTYILHFDLKLLKKQIQILSKKLLPKTYKASSFTLILIVIHIQLHAISFTNSAANFTQSMSFNYSPLGLNDNIKCSVKIH